MNEGEKPNFILVLLCDNDFGQELETATRLIYERAEVMNPFPDPAWFLDQVVRLTMALSVLRLPGTPDALHINEHAVRRYFHDNVKVHYYGRIGVIDHDGGSVGIDTNMNFIWRF